MTTFVRTLVAKDGYKEKEVKNGFMVLHFDASGAAEGMLECAEAIVAEGYDAENLKAEYEAWKVAQEKLALSSAIKAKQRAIMAYDVSDSVNSFTLRHGDASFSYWLAAAKRNQLVTSVTSWGNTHDSYRLDLREYGVYIDMDCNTLLEMLSKLEDYAVGCYNATSANLCAVAKLGSVAEVDAFDVSSGYPEKLVFEV